MLIMNPKSKLKTIHSMLPELPVLTRSRSTMVCRAGGRPPALGAASPRLELPVGLGHSPRGGAPLSERPQPLDLLLELVAALLDAIAAELSRSRMNPAPAQPASRRYKDRRWRRFMRPDFIRSG